MLALVRCTARALETAKQAEKAAFLDAQLLLGRFCWLLKINGSFIERSLGVAAAPQSASPQRQAHRQDSSSYFTSYGQLQSAFDIADSDGDGFITYEEAVEVPPLADACTFSVLYSVFICIFVLLSGTASTVRGGSRGGGRRAFGGSEFGRLRVAQ